jgi:hypothetical protein
MMHDGISFDNILPKQVCYFPRLFYFLRVPLAKELHTNILILFTAAGTGVVGAVIGMLMLIVVEVALGISLW